MSDTPVSENGDILERIDAATEGATPVPWVIEIRHDLGDWPSIWITAQKDTDDEVWVGRIIADADANLIAAAPSLLADARAEIVGLREQLAEARHLAVEWRQDAGDRTFDYVRNASERRRKIDAYFIEYPLPWERTEPQLAEGMAAIREAERKAWERS